MARYKAEILGFKFPFHYDSLLVRLVRLVRLNLFVQICQKDQVAHNVQLGNTTHIDQIGQTGQIGQI